MDCAPTTLVFPLSRYVYYGEFRYYYGYGNTPPDDYLENASGVIEPEILVLGCGDLRSCLYTLWKNFSFANSTSCFKGVHFLLNDISDAVLARNILFLYLCLKMPKEKEDIKEWLCAVWAIWFCHELMPKHEAILNDALSALIKFSSSAKSWTSKDNPLHALVKFTSPQVLSEISRVWKMWHKKDVQGVKSVKAMKSARLDGQIKANLKEMIDNGSIATGFLAGAFGLFNMAEITKSNHGLYEKMESEVVSYYRTGSVFAEEMLSELPQPYKSVVNYTVYERSDGRFTMHYACLPFNSFYHSFQYTLKFISEIKGPKINLLVPDSCFETHPLLANCFQQFSIWFQGCAKVLSRENGPIVSFTFNCSDAIQLCQELQSPTHLPNMEVGNKFDLVYTSNLIDHLAPPNLVLAALPLIKSSSFLFTTTLLYKSIASTAEGYIRACFGFESKLLPVIFGIRCINHEGEPYSSVVSSQPAPFQYGNTCVENKQWPKLLIWERVDMHPLKVSTLVGDSNVAAALCSSIRLCITPLFTSQKGPRTINHLCIETAIKILQMYAAVVDADVSSFQFWSDLCQLVLKEESIKPFLHAFQTQCLLHGLHLHLTMGETTCPICSDIPLAEHIGQFSIAINLPLARQITPNFMAFIHKCPLEDPLQLQFKAFTGMGVYLFDSLCENRNGELNFYCPKSFADDDYNVTLVGYLVGGMGTAMKNSTKELIIPFVNNHKKLSTCRVPGITHHFQSTRSHQSIVSSPFGTVSSHSGDGNYFESVVQLSDATLAELSSGTSASTKQITPSEIEVSCGKLKHNIRYPHPIEYDRLAVKISRKKRNTTVLASRTAYNFEEEKPLFQVNPENCLVFPPSIASSDAMFSYCGMQYTKRDRKIMENCRRENALMPIMVNLKESFNIMFQCCEEHFFHIVLPVGGVHALLMVQNQVFDIERKTPALDLAFCFLEESFVRRVATKWQSIAPSNVRGICMDDGEYKLAKKVFTYFSNRTTLKTVRNAKGRLQLLSKTQISQYFTRAVVYPLYADPDFYVLDMNYPKMDLPITNPDDTPSSSPIADKKSTMLKKCCQCGQQSPNLKKCANCGKVLYCSRECQKKHWKEHKPDCHRATKAPIAPKPEVTASKCDGCGGMFPLLKKCPCHQVAYCGVMCQKKDWPKHKTTCTNKLAK